jgi:phage major head subunit gpT-like protein
MIANDFPKHLIVGARSGFLAGLKDIPLPWTRVASLIPIGAAALDLVDLGASPMPTESIGRPNIQEFIEKTIAVKPKTWDIVVRLSYNAVQDDQTGSLLRKAQGAGVNFQRHINSQVFKVLNGGDGTTYGLCYDGQEFFDSDHKDKGATYQTNQDNEFALALSNDNFTTVRIAASKVKDDQGQFSGYNYDLLVIPPDLEKKAAQITMNREEAGTANRDINPYSGKTDYVVSPELDSTAWHLIASNESVKPLLLVMRQNPFLQEAWFAPLEGDEGGYYYFKFMARYNVYFGDWRLAFQGNT